MGAKKQATVSGPGVLKGYASPSVALSAAITFAGRAANDTTLYVRDADDQPYGRVERDEHGHLEIYRTASR